MFAFRLKTSLVLIQSGSRVSGRESESSSSPNKVLHGWEPSLQKGVHLDWNQLNHRGPRKEPSRTHAMYSKNQFIFTVHWGFDFGIQYRRRFEPGTAEQAGASVSSRGRPPKAYPSRRGAKGTDRSRRDKSCRAFLRGRHHPSRLGRGIVCGPAVSSRNGGVDLRPGAVPPPARRKVLFCFKEDLTEPERRAIIKD